MVAAAAAERAEVDNSHYVIDETVLGFAIQDFTAAMGAQGWGREYVSRGCFHLHARRSCRAFYSFGTARWQQPVDLGSHSHNKKHPPLAPRSENRAAPIQRTVQRAKASTFYRNEWYPFPCALTTASIRRGIGQIVIESRIPASEFPLYALGRWKRKSKSRTVPSPTGSGKELDGCCGTS